MPLFRSSTLALALLTLSLVPACGYGDTRRHGYYDDDSYDPSPPPAGTIEQATIDADQLLDAEPGEGAGAFVEYESGGTYHVTTSCNVSSGVDCLWDIVVTPLDGAPILTISPFDLEADDSLTFGEVNRLRLLAYTGDDFDGFDFQTEPGAGIEVDVFLDDGAANKFLFWVGDGAVHNGAPSNPVDLIPSAE
ncbi:MAG: hypothetical protein EOO73_31305 [Myxococcales bacterium]|nr:MAG: hypothetical protein EOO73_31305 [Myxococcales bacterium]